MIRLDTSFLIRMSVTFVASLPSDVSRGVHPLV